MKMYRTLLWLLPALALALGGMSALYFHRQNTAMKLTQYTLPLTGLPDGFHGLRIVVLSDLHGSWYGWDQQRLVELVKAQRPDLIVMAGDMIDGRRKQADAALSLCRQMPDIAPTYMIYGNHERYLTGIERAAFTRDATAWGAVMLRNEAVSLELNGASLSLMGLDDPHYFIPDSLPPAQYQNQVTAYYTRVLRHYGVPEGGLGIVLCHDPSAQQAILSQGWRVVLSGHTHGGQIGLGADRGLVVPGAGLWARAAGAQAMGGGWGVISRGLGNSSFPLRVNNPSEVVVVELTKE